MTEWREVERGYAVSDDGQVRSPSGRVRKQQVDEAGRHTVLFTYGHPVMRRVSRLVAEAFHGAPPVEGAMALHNDGNPHNNRADNLRWGTGLENAADSRSHDTAVHGSRVPTTKLTEGQVREIVGRVQRGDRLVDIAGDYGVSQPLISNIMSGKLWQRVTGIKERDKASSVERRSARAKQTFGTGGQVKVACPNGCGLETYPGPMGKHLTKC